MPGRPPKPRKHYVEESDGQVLKGVGVGYCGVCGMLRYSQEDGVEISLSREMLGKNLDLTIRGNQSEKYATVMVTGRRRDGAS